jgi:hypothetical protein
MFGSSSSGDCQLCPAGKMGTFSGKCVDCPESTWQDEVGQSNCKDCNIDISNDILDLHYCYYTTAKGSTYDFPTADGNPTSAWGAYLNDQTVESCGRLCKIAYPRSTEISMKNNQCACCDNNNPDKEIKYWNGGSEYKVYSSLVVPYSKARSTQQSDCFDINGIVSYVFGMKDDGKISQSLETSCEIRPNMVLYCPSCTCKSDVRDGYWAGPLCDECRRGFAGGQVGKCLIKCPGYDGVHDSTMCNGKGKCWYGKHGSGECLCGGKNVLDSTSGNVVVSVKTCPAGQKCPGYGTDTVDVTQYKPLYYQLEYRQYSVFVLQKNTHTPARGHMWFERFSPQNIYENVCSTCIAKYDKTPYTEIGYFKANNSDYVQFKPRLQLENGFHGENCQYECAACLNNGKCLNTPHSFYYSYAIENVIGTSTPVFLPQTQCICSSSIYDGDAMCCPHGFEPYVYFGKRDVLPYFQYTALPFITNVVNRILPYWTDEDMWLNSDGHGHTLSYKQPVDNQIFVSDINNINKGPKYVQKNYEEIGPYTKHTFYGTEQDICRACPGLFGKGVKSRSTSLNTASDAEDFWWDSSAIGKKCNGVGVCDFYSQQSESSVLFMGKYELSHGIKFTRHRRFTSCREIVNQMNRNVRKLDLAACIQATIDAQQSSFVYSESYKFVYNNVTMSKTGDRRTGSFASYIATTGGAQDQKKPNKKGYISTATEDQDGITGFWRVESVDANYVPPPNPNGDYIFHPWNEDDCQISTSPCVETDHEEYSLYMVGQTGQGADRLDSASHDRFDTCLTYDDGTFKTKLGNYITKTYENGEDPFLGSHCPKGHFCSKTGIDTADTVGFKEACPSGYFQPDLHQTRTTNAIQCSKLTNPDASCNENEATLKMDFIDKRCQRCQPNEYAPEGSAACTACPVGRVKKLSGNIDPIVLENMYNIPIPKGGTYWYYIEDETGLVHSDCALVPNGIIHVPTADQYMDFGNPRLLPVFPCPFTYSSQPGTFVFNEHDSVVRLLSLGRNVISAPYTQVDDTVAYTQASPNGIKYNSIANTDVYTMNHQGTEWIVLMKASGTQGANTAPNTGNSVVDPTQVGYQYMKETTFQNFKNSDVNIRVRAWNSDTPELYMECTLDKYEGTQTKYYNNWKAETDCIQMVRNEKTKEMVSLPLPNPFLTTPIGSGFTYTSGYNSINPSNAVTGNSIFTKKHNGDKKWTTQIYSNIDIFVLHFDQYYCYYKDGSTSTYDYPTADGTIGNTYLDDQTVESCGRLCKSAFPTSTYIFMKNNQCGCCDNNNPTKEIKWHNGGSAYKVYSAGVVADYAVEGNIAGHYGVWTTETSKALIYAIQPRSNFQLKNRELYAEAQQKLVKDYCFNCPSSSMTGPGSTICSTCYQDRVSSNTKQIIQLKTEGSYQLLLPTTFSLQPVNLSLSSEVEASSLYSSSYPHSNCIDGNPATFCHTRKDANAWLKVKLQTPSPVSFVEITNRKTSYQRLGTFNLYYFDNVAMNHPILCVGSPYTWVGNGDAPQNFQCNTDGEAAYGIKIQQTDTEHLNLADVNIYGTNAARQRYANSYPRKITHSAVIEKTGGGTIVSGFSTRTLEAVYLAEVTMFCNYFDPAYVAIQLNIPTTNPVGFEHTCIKSIGIGAVADTILYETIGNTAWTVEFPLCEGCPSGRYQSAQPGMCDACEAGYYTSTMAEAEQRSCQPCAVGRFNTETESQSCESCVSGKYQSQEGGTMCTECDKGKYEPLHGQANCKDCETGFYMEVKGSSTACKSCVAGKHWTSTTETCNGCNSGKYTSNAAEAKLASCKPCVPGKKHTTFTTACAGCASGQYQDQNEQRSCKGCPPGQFQNQGTQIGCKACIPGQYQTQTGKTSCVHCAAGTQYEKKYGKKSCKACRKGKFASSKGHSYCKYCPPGKYKGNTGAGGCSGCNYGSFQDKQGQQSCKYCPPGTRTPYWGSKSCQKCLKGRATSDYGKYWCDYCAPGKIAHSEGQKACSRCRSHWSGSKRPEYQNQHGQKSCKVCSGEVTPKKLSGHWGAMGCKKKATPARRRRRWNLFRT